MELTEKHSNGKLLRSNSSPNLGTYKNGGLEPLLSNSFPVNELEPLTSKESYEAGITKEYKHKYLIYGILDSPPIYITAIAGLQQILFSLASQILTSLLVADAVCAANNYVFKAQLISSTLVLNGITTIAMCYFGVRLPLFQGASPLYIIPLLSIGTLDASGTFCSGSESTFGKGTEANATSGNVSIESAPYDMDLILRNTRALSGSLVAAGVIHTLLGFTGLVGVVLKFVGPVTVVPSLVLVAIYITKVALKFVEVHWGISMMTMSIAVILSLYLASREMPIPVWTPTIGFRIIRYPVHQVFAILISMLVGWMVCGILTEAGALTNDPNDIEFKARTDARSQDIKDTQWFYFPYPGQFGPMSFSVAAFISCMIATLLSVLDSIADYIACARICRVPPPPAHAVNRGLLIEGLCSFLAGTVGCGHATNSNGGNIGAIGITRVASRHVFVAVGIIYIIFGFMGKVCAIFVTIPHPVLGGAFVILFGMYTGVVLSNMQAMDMSSSRNLAIVGLSIFIGLLIPIWIEKEKGGIYTGNEAADNILVMILGNPNLAGTLLAMFLDNTVPGTAKERGIEAWQVKEEDQMAPLGEEYDEGYEIYTPLLPKSVLRAKILKYIPFLPNPVRERHRNCRV